MNAIHNQNNIKKIIEKKLELKSIKIVKGPPAMPPFIGLVKPKKTKILTLFKTPASSVKRVQ